MENINKTNDFTSHNRNLLIYIYKYIYIYRQMITHSINNNIQHNIIFWSLEFDFLERIILIVEYILMSTLASNESMLF